MAKKPVQIYQIKVTLNEANYTLNQVIYREGQRFNYEYDFGDSWEHTLLVEKILPPEGGVYYPLCLKGKRACPPEDVGGVWGYEYFLEAIQNPNHEEHEHYLEWAEEGFDPESFHLDEINAGLRRMGRGRSTEALDDWSKEETRSMERMFDLISAWQQKLTNDQRDIAENLPLRRDIITLLTYLRDNKVTGTASTGNLPLKAVHAICARFVNPPRLEEPVGEHTYRIRSEIEVWPLYFLHVLATNGGLISGGISRRWILTQVGERFLDITAPLQLWHLLATWWTQTNWVIATPFGYDDGYFPSVFYKLTLTHLLDLPVDSPVAFEHFADALGEAAKLTWQAERQENVKFFLQSLVERSVVNPLVDFGILASAYETHKILGEGYRELSTFWITHFGKSLLEAISEVTR